MIRDNWKSLCAPRDRRPIYEWAADAFDQLPAALTIRDPKRLRDSRHFLPVFDALWDDSVRRVVLYKPTRGGGTLISDLWHVSCRARDPGPAMIVLQSDDEAKKHAETRTMPMMLGCAAIKPYLPDNPDRIRSQAIMFADNLPFYIHGPGVNKLQSKGLRYITCDEPWLYDPGTINEAEQRMGDYALKHLDKMFLCSQGGVEGDDLDTYWRKGDCAIWSVECMGCAKVFAPLWSYPLSTGKFAGMRWDEHRDERGFWRVNACLENVRYQCPHCGHEHYDRVTTRDAWNASGRYVATNPDADAKIRSFRWNAIIYFPWRELVSEYLAAINARKMGIVEPLIAFFQKRMAEPKSEATLMEGSLTFRRESITITDPQPDELLRAMTCDRQVEDLYWVTVRSWKETGESRRLWWGQLIGRAALKAKADEYKCTTVAVDSGHEAKGDMGVYAICADFNTAEQRWLALKGTDDEWFWHLLPDKSRIRRSYSEPSLGDPERGDKSQGQIAAILVRFSSPVMKSRVQQLIRFGLWIEPDDKDTPDGREYVRQMQSEYLKPKVDKFTGKEKLVWVCPSKNNHAFDCAAMQCALATMASILPDTEIEMARKTI